LLSFLSGLLLTLRLLSGRWSVPAPVIPVPGAAGTHLLLSVLEVSGKILGDLLNGLQKVFMVVDFHFQLSELLGIGLFGDPDH
jgi:hypothetical protein